MPSSNPPAVLRPYFKAEALSVARAAEIAGKSCGTVRTWCSLHDIGRRVAGGSWQVSRVALRLVLEGDKRALEQYLSGDRTSPNVTDAFEACGLGALLREGVRDAA